MRWRRSEVGGVDDGRVVVVVEHGEEHRGVGGEGGVAAVAGLHREGDAADVLVVEAAQGVDGAVGRVDGDVGGDGTPLDQGLHHRVGHLAVGEIGRASCRERVSSPV